MNVATPEYTTPLDPLRPEELQSNVVEPEVAERLISLDALRGFDMFWIVGAEDLVNSLNKISPSGVTGFFATQLSHVEWRGLHFYDIIFPLFVFLMGVAIPYSLDKHVREEGKGKAHVRLLRRFILLYIIGIIYYGGMSRLWPEFRFVGVLQRIAIGYFFAGLLYLNLRLRYVVVACIVILAGYWAFFSFVPVPAEPELSAINAEWGQGGVSFEQGNNWAHYIDFHYLPGRRWDTYWDPEGLLSNIPAVGTALLGVFAGVLLRSGSSKYAKVFWLIGAGILAVIAGTLLGLQFPIIKKIWTTSYVLAAGGYGLILLGAFYLIIDVWKVKRWATPFVWIGSNALVAYLAVRFIEFEELAKLFVGGHVQNAAGRYGDLLVTIVAMALLFALLRFLYKRKIFIRI